MMQNPFDQFDAPAQPQTPGIIMGRPKQPTPIQISADRRDDARLAIDQDKNARDAQLDAVRLENERIKLQQGQAGAGGSLDPKTVTGQANIAKVVLNAAGVTGNSDPVADLIKGSTSGWLQQAGADAYGAVTGEATDGMENIGRLQTIANDMVLQMSGGSLGAQISDGDRKFIAARMGDIGNPDIPYNQRLAAWDQVKKRLYAISGDSGSGRQDLEIFVNPGLAVNGVITNPAPNTPSSGDGTRRPEMVGNVPLGTDVRVGPIGGDDPYNRGDFLASRGLDANKEATAMAFWNQNSGNQDLSAMGALRFYAENGIPPPSDDDIERMVEQAKAGYRFGPLDDSAEKAAYEAKLKAASEQQGEAGYGERVDQGVTLGLSDEIEGVGGAVSSILQGKNPAQGYRFSRDVARYRNREANKNTGYTGDAVEIGSGLLLPFGSAKTVRQAVKTGMGYGAVGGFGYGEGAEGSLAGSGFGAALGGTIGYGAQRGGNALMSYLDNRALSAANRNELLLAAENLGISKPAQIFTEQSKQNRARAVSSTIAGGDDIRAGVQRFGDEIRGATERLSPGKPIADNEAAGGVIKSAGERFIEKSGKSARKQYEQAERLAGSAKLSPEGAIQVLDDAIARLNETPNSNKAELAYLADLKADLGKNLSVGALRDLRTTLRKKISKGELVFGQNEARVLSVMSALSDDIERGLRASGNAKAAAAFRAADKKYAARMDFITNTLQKVIGKRNSNLSNEQVMAKFRSLSKTDSAALRKFYASLEPDEAADISATFAEAIGRKGGAKDFSTATLIDSIEELKKAGASIETIFGPQGAKALGDIELLAREHKRVSGAISGQGSAQGNDWRWTLGSMLIPGAGGFVASDGGTAAAAALAGLIIKAGRDKLSAKMLLSPKVANWFRTAPHSSAPRAIDAHFAKLGAIAKAEPAIAADIEAFRTAILQAANDNTQRAVAEDRQN